MKLKFYLLVCFTIFTTRVVFAQDPVSVAKQFCIAVYENNMIQAKSLMTTESARRTPDKMSFSEGEGALYIKKLSTAHYRIIDGITSSIVTVRFYDPQYEYLSKKGRWFCCAITLVKTSGRWLVVDYGY